MADVVMTLIAILCLVALYGLLSPRVRSAEQERIDWYNKQLAERVRHEASAR